MSLSRKRHARGMPKHKAHQFELDAGIAFRLVSEETIDWAKHQAETEQTRRARAENEKTQTDLSLDVPDIVATG